MVQDLLGGAVYGNFCHILMPAPMPIRSGNGLHFYHECATRLLGDPHVHENQITPHPRSRGNSR